MSTRSVVNLMMTISKRNLLLGLLAGLAMVGLSGCSLLLDFSECETNGDCAQGVCDDGVCVAPPSCTARADCAGYDAAAYCLAGQCRVIDETRCKPYGKVFDESPDEVIIPVGGLMPLSGSDVAKGTATIDGAELAFRQLNRSKALAAGQLGLITCDTYDEDTELRAANAAAHATYLVDDLGVQAIIGEIASSATIEVVDEVADDEGALIISPASTSPALSNRSDNFWRTIPSDATQAPAMAQLIRELGATKVAVLYDKDDAYTAGFFDSLNFYWAGASDKPEFKLGTYTRGMIDTETVSTINAQALYGAGWKPEVIILLGSTGDLPLLVNIERDYVDDLQDEEKPIWVVPETMRSQPLLDQTALAGAFDRIIGTVPLRTETPIFATYETNYRAEFPGQDPLAFQFPDKAYDAAYLIALAFNAQESPLTATGDALSKVLERVTSGMTINATTAEFSSISGTLRSGGSVDLIGVSGPLTFDASHDITDANIARWSIDTEGSTPRFVNGEAIEVQE